MKRALAIVPLKIRERRSTGGRPLTCVHQLPREAGRLHYEWPSDHWPAERVQVDRFKSVEVRGAQPRRIHRSEYTVQDTLSMMRRPSGGKAQAGLTDPAIAVQKDRFHGENARKR